MEDERKGNGKTRSGVSETRGKGPSPGLRMVPNMEAGGSHPQTMLRVPEETGDETTVYAPEERSNRQTRTPTSHAKTEVCQCHFFSDWEAIQRHCFVSTRFGFILAQELYRRRMIMTNR